MLKKSDGLDKDDPTETVLQLSENPSKVHKFDDEDEPFDIFAIGISNLDVANAIRAAVGGNPTTLYTVHRRDIKPEGEDFKFTRLLEKSIKNYVRNCRDKFNFSSDSKDVVTFLTREDAIKHANEELEKFKKGRKIRQWWDQTPTSQHVV
jgi:hypothetical protein